MRKTKDIIFNLRTGFNHAGLDEKQMDKNPINQFRNWMNDALQAKASEPNAMTLATIGKNNFPDARIVLLRGFDKNGFTFFTNYKSAKGKELDSKKACLNFFWIELSRQVRITGTVKKATAEASDEYFNSRPRESQIGAWVSAQSTVIVDRNVLDEKFNLLEKEFQNKKVPRPSYWGGYIVNPVRIEFWQGRQNRLHDRVLYSILKNGKWKMDRLSP